MIKQKKGFTQPHFSRMNEVAGVKSTTALSPKSGAGFTLIELLVVIAIIGILSAIGLVSLNGAREKARDSKRVSDLSVIATALALYYDDQVPSTYPYAAGLGGVTHSSVAGAAWTVVGGAGTGFSGALVPNYIAQLPLSSGSGDTGQTTYLYLASTDGAHYFIRTKLEGVGTNFYYINDRGIAAKTGFSANPPITCNTGSSGTCPASLGS